MGMFGSRVVRSTYHQLGRSDPAVATTTPPNPNYGTLINPTALAETKMVQGDCGLGGNEMDDGWS
jgi:hypothetical protein